MSESVMEFSIDPTWAPQGREPAYVGTFDPTHRRNLYTFLCRRAAMLELSDALRIMTSPIQPQGDMACLDFDNYLDDRARRPLSWLLGTRFMQALAALLIGDGNQATVAEWEDRAAAE